MAELLYKGSVKDIYQITPATATEFGQGYMFFRPHKDFPGCGAFSVFDYGEMPWGIKGKHDDLYKETLRFKEVLEDAGMETHFTHDMGDNKIGIKLARMLGYDEIKAEGGKGIMYRIPIECVFSHAVTPVASLHKRLMKGERDPKDYGLKRTPEAGETVILPEIGTSYSTKIETTDVYKGLDSMAELAGLVGDEKVRLNDLTIKAAKTLIRDAGQVGITLADGKFEFVMGPNRNFMVADTGYTWDENRILYQLNDGRYVDLSKQFARNVYTIMGWKDELKKAQQEFPDDKSHWPAPPEVGDDIKGLCADMCTAVRHELTRESGGPRLAIVARRAMDTLDFLKERYGRDETGAQI
jgi:phosphoribosylaminoimidazole-succinocarboxamide synthase